MFKNPTHSLNLVGAVLIRADLLGGRVGVCSTGGVTGGEGVGEESTLTGIWEV